MTEPEPTKSEQDQAMDALLGVLRDIDRMQAEYDRLRESERTLGDADESTDG